MFTDKGSGAWTDQLQSMFTVGRHGANENNFEGALGEHGQAGEDMVAAA